MVLITRDGWIKRQRNVNLESTRMREGDAPLALLGGSTRESIVLFSNRRLGLRGPHQRRAAVERARRPRSKSCSSSRTARR